MGREAVVLGGAGQTGVAIARRLVRDGWAVVLATRGRRRLPGSLAELGVRQVPFDRSDPTADLRRLATGRDLLVDCICYTEPEARQLLAAAEGVGHLTVISTAAVYVDHAGRTMFATEPELFPCYPDRITEDQPTVPAGSDTYATRKRLVEKILLDGCSVPVTVLRPAAIHGPHSTHLREWHFVKRALDRRPHVLLADGGRNRFQTTATANLGELVRLTATDPEHRVLNAADPEAPSVLEISRAVARLLDHDRREIPLPAHAPAPLGLTPWTVPNPVVLSTDRATRDLGYRPACRYDQALAEEIDWVVRATADRDWREVLPRMTSAYSGVDYFDYSTEDTYLEQSSVD
ncbi:NAD-dependent epimerase/dehydratase family protein [Streptoalloteichus hindustanus]|uniref:NAD-dependent epimerase/dehydratase family protein n=1 Tax=Streptoalloteichus hindustanus TaxID=2017 RepID=UPI0013564379|nr:NAD(P)H-binding protein [Streptoalloteichus hindustanus]